jgi:rod shape-determining protein MreC
MSAQVKGEKSNLLLESVQRLAAPVVGLTHATLAAIQSGWENYADLRAVRRTNRELSHRIQELQVEHQQLEDLQRENARLRELLGLRARLPMVLTAARVISNQSRSPERTLRLDRGTEHGVRPNMPVVVEEGVVGRVIDAQPHSSKVQLIVGAGAAVAVRIERTGLQGILAGRGGDILKLQYIPEQEDVREGDCLVTSGHDQIYPGSEDFRFHVGCIVSVRTRSRTRPDAAPAPETGLMLDIDVRPAVSFSRLQEVLVLQHSTWMDLSGNEPPASGDVSSGAPR